MSLKCVSSCDFRSKNGTARNRSYSTRNSTTWRRNTASRRNATQPATCSLTACSSTPSLTTDVVYIPATTAIRRSLAMSKRFGIAFLVSILLMNL